MSYINARPAGDSEDECSDDEFVFSSDYGREVNNQREFQEEKESDESLFYTALRNEDIGTLKTMLTKGFKVDEPLIGGWSPLMHACSLGLLSVVEFFIEAGANVNFNKEMFTSLMAVCKSKSHNEDELMKCLDLLLKHNVNINALDRNACTALMYACISGHVELVKKLIECGCDVNIQDSEGWSALFHAVFEGQEHVIIVLLKGNARVDLIDRRRRSPFELAMQKGHSHLAKLVCTKREKKKIVEQENLPVFGVTVKTPVEEMLAQLPSTNAKNISGFSTDVGKLLWAMDLGHLDKQFSSGNVQLNELLLIADDRLKELGVRFSVHRQLILDSIRKFHLHQWNKASLGMKPRNQQMTVEDGVRLICNVTKHLHILNATINYIRIHQPIPFRPNAFKLCESTIHQIGLISGELDVIRLFALNLKHKEKIEPVDLIKPRKNSQRLFVPILATSVVIGLLLWRRKISIRFSSF